MRMLLIAGLVAAAAMIAPAGAGAGGAVQPFTVETDIGYAPHGGGPLNQLDVYRPVPAPSSPAPVVVYVHGGSWAVGDKGNRIADKARLFTSAGYVFVSVNYRLSPNPPEIGNASRIRFPVHPNDVATALGWIHGTIAGRGGDPDRIVLVGHSAGAHLVALAGFDESLLRSHAVPPKAIRGVVPLDTDSFDIASEADPDNPANSFSQRLTLWNAFGTPGENAVDGSWAAASPLGKGDGLDPPALFVTQSNKPNRLAANRAMAADVGLDPDTAVVGVPLDHEGINESLGSPGDTTAETEAVSDFVAEALAIDGAPKTKLTKKPKARVKSRSKRKKVRFEFRSGDARATYECRIDKKKWRGCSSPTSYRLKKGKHRFRVRSLTRDGHGRARSDRFRIVRR